MTTSSDAASARWHAVLDDYEADLRRRRAALDELATATGPATAPATGGDGFRPPPDLPPAPPEVRDRLVALRVATDELAADMTALLARVARRRTTTSRPIERDGLLDRSM